MPITDVRVDARFALGELAVWEVTTAGRTRFRALLNIEQRQLCFLIRRTHQYRVVMTLRDYHLLVNEFKSGNSTLAPPFGA